MIKLKDVAVVDDIETRSVVCHLDFTIINSLQDFIDIYARQIVKEIVTERLNKLLTDKDLIKITNKSITETYFKDKLVEKILNQLKESEKTNEQN